MDGFAFMYVCAQNVQGGQKGASNPLVERLLPCGFWESNRSLWKSSQPSDISLQFPYHGFSALGPGSRCTEEHHPLHSVLSFATSLPPRYSESGESHL